MAATISLLPACATDDKASGWVRSGFGADGAALRSGGVEVRVPAGSVDGDVDDGELRLRVGGKAPAPLPEGATAAGPLVSVELEGATLVGEATIVLPVEQPDGEHVAAVAFYDTDLEAWQLVPADVRGTTATVATAHFSDWMSVFIDAGEILSRVADAMKNVATGRAGAAQPACENEADARAAGVEVSSDDGDLVKWCFGVEDGAQVLRIVNNRNAAALLTFPRAWAPGDVSGEGISFVSLGRFLDSKAPAPRGIQSRVVGAGGTIDLAVPAGSGGTVTVEMSMLTWAFANWDVAVDVLAMIASRWVKADGVEQSLAGALTYNDAGDAGSFFTCFQEVFGPEIDPRHPVEEARPSDIALAAKFALKCGWDALEQALGAGANEFVRATVVTLGLVIGVAIGAVSTITSGLRNAFDTLTGDARYRIQVNSDSAASTDKEILQAVGCTSSGCGVEGRHGFTHPTWGPSQVVWVTGEPHVESGSLYVLDADLYVRWSSPDIGFPVMEPPLSTDSTGNILGGASYGTRAIFVHVLRAVPNGMTDIADGITSSDRLDFPDLDDDGALEMSTTDNDCDPSCADGMLSEYLWRWNGREYELFATRPNIGRNDL